MSQSGDDGGGFTELERKMESDSRARETKRMMSRDVPKRLMMAPIATMIVDPTAYGSTVSPESAKKVEVLLCMVAFRSCCWKACFWVESPDATNALDDNLGARSKRKHADFDACLYSPRTSVEKYTQIKYHRSETRNTH